MDWKDHGYNMKVYKPDPDDPQSISSGQIIKIYEDHTGTLWVGTLIGLNKFDRRNETFKRYIYNTDGSTNVTSKSVRLYMKIKKEGCLLVQIIPWNYLTVQPEASNGFTTHKTQF